MMEEMLMSDVEEGRKNEKNEIKRKDRVSERDSG